MTRVLIVAGIGLYREGIALILAREDDLDVVGTAQSVGEAIPLVCTLRPDIVLVDTADCDGLAAVRAIVAAEPSVRVVALAVPEREPDVVAYAEAGVAGYLPRDAGLQALSDTIGSVARGETLCSPRMAATLLRRVATLAAERRLAAAPMSHLTARELQIVKLIDGGLSNKEIARRLCIEVPTVKNHVHNILEKLQVRRRSEAAAWIRAAHASLAFEPPTI